MNFQSLSLIEPILKAVSEEGYSEPTPIQAMAIPLVLQGSDVLGSAQTGTGKTAAFAIPIIQNLSKVPTRDRSRRIRALIVTPTRELAIQIDESFKAYGRYTSIRSQVIFGGVNQHGQVNLLREGTDVMVATPGRLLDLMGQGIISLKDIEIFVLDEADRMLDMGFIHDVRRIISSLPSKRQSLFFSATMPPEIVKLSQAILHLPERVEIHPGITTVEIIRQGVYFVDKGNKNALLLDVLNEYQIRSVLVFTRTKHGADKVAKMLVRNNVQAEAIHGNKAQNARQRALSNFKNQVTRVLVATDIAARGIDVENMEWVINFEIPNIPETYVHRIGRTGRAGAGGTAFSFCDAEEKAYVRDIEKLIGQRIPEMENLVYPLIDHHPVKEPRKPFVRPEARGRQVSEPTPARNHPNPRHPANRRFKSS